MSRVVIPESSIIEQENIITQTDLIADIRNLEDNFEKVVIEAINYLNTIDKRAGTRAIADAINNIELRTDNLLFHGHITGKPQHNEVRGRLVYTVPAEKGDGE